MYNSHVLASVLLAAVLGVGSVGQASATPQSEQQTYSRKVQVSDLNISSGPGAQELLRRIHRAARKVCDMGDNSVLSTRSRAYRTCVRQAQDRAVAQVNSPLVTALYQGSSTTEIAAK